MYVAGSEVGGSVVERFRVLDLKSGVPGSNPPSDYYLDLFSVVLSSSPRPRCVNNQLVSFPPVGILYIYNICLFIYSVPNLQNSAKYIRHLNKVINTRSISSSTRME